MLSAWSPSSSLATMSQPVLLLCPATILSYSAPALAPAWLLCSAAPAALPVLLLVPAEAPMPLAVPHGHKSLHRHRGSVEPAHQIPAAVRAPA